jgi:geranylgeranylglycerol-phosphate geranylgeranyltransferase
VNLIALWGASRPVNALLAALSVALGFALAPHSNIQSMILSALAVGLVVCAGNWDNDLQDQSTDSINRPHRALIAGQCTPQQFAWARNLSVTAALALGGLAHWQIGLQITLMLILLWTYNRHLKRLPLLGNLAVALLCAWAVVLTHIPNIPAKVWPALVFAFVLNLIREWVKDAQDFEGDEQAGMKTIAVWAGPELTLLAARLALIFVMVALPLPWQTGLYDLRYAVLALILAGPPLFLAWRIRGSSPAEIARMSHALKWGMLGGLIALASNAPLLSTFYP